MRIVVTGGSGFLGQELIQVLHSEGHQIINIDLVPSDWPATEEFIVDLTREYPKIKFDFCFHLASGTGGILFNQDAGIVDYNNRINYNVSRMCGNTPVVFISSTNVFEGCKSIHDDINPITFYSKSKASGEYFLKHNNSNLHIVRSTNMFGRSQITKFVRYGESHVIPDMFYKINQDGDDLEVWGDGTQTRNFLHTRDLCNYLKTLLKEPLGVTYHNVCSSITLSIDELICALLDFLGKKKNIVYNDFYMQYEKIRIDHFVKDLRDIGSITTISEGLLS